MVGVEEWAVEGVHSLFRVVGVVVEVAGVDPVQPLSIHSPSIVAGVESVEVEALDRLRVRGAVESRPACSVCLRSALRWRITSTQAGVAR